MGSRLRNSRHLGPPDPSSRRDFAHGRFLRQSGNPCSAKSVKTVRKPQASSGCRMILHDGPTGYLGLLPCAPGFLGRHSGLQEALAAALCREDASETWSGRITRSANIRRNVPAGEIHVVLPPVHAFARRVSGIGRASCRKGLPPHAGPDPGRAA